MRLTKLLPLIGIALLAYIIWKIGLDKIIKSIAEADYSMLLLYLLLFIPMLFLQTYKWDYLLKRQKVRFGFKYLLKLQVISTFYEIITPARIGSFIKIAYINKKLGNFGKSASSVVIDRFMDFLLVALLAFIGAISLVSNNKNIYFSSI